MWNNFGFIQQVGRSHFLQTACNSSGSANGHARSYNGGYAKRNGLSHNHHNHAIRFRFAIRIFCESWIGTISKCHGNGYERLCKFRRDLVADWHRMQRWDLRIDLRHVQPIWCRNFLHPARRAPHSADGNAYRDDGSQPDSHGFFNDHYHFGNPNHPQSRA
jgi:hypothetical protein